jgi:predicted house-cleaning NTP pyrophosphatase (Maf/HAM1 superfamily)
MAESFVKEISGSWSNVVGLPLAMTVSLLTGAGYGA